MTAGQDAPWGYLDDLSDHAKAQTCMSLVEAIRDLCVAIVKEQ